MLGFEPRTSYDVSNCSASCAMTTAQKILSLAKKQFGSLFLLLLPRDPIYGISCVVKLGVGIDPQGTETNLTRTKKK